ncbi:O-antigen ligase family protein, partial [Alphaproteobacteria bacterium]|nr:O-antigen ligase family protein [Alphaproteobacteria bacterium]
QIEKSYTCNKDQLEKKLLYKECKKIINLQPEFFQILKNFTVSAYGEIYKLSIMMFKDHLFIGIGLNNFTYLCKNDERYKNQIKNYDCPSHPHNIYIQFLVETGLFGFLFFIIYLFFIFSFIFKNNFNKYSLIGVSSLVILFWPIMSTGSLLKNWNGISTFFIIGLSLTISKLYKKSN